MSTIAPPNPSSAVPAACVASPRLTRPGHAAIMPPSARPVTPASAIAAVTPTSEGLPRTAAGGAELLAREPVQQRLALGEVGRDDLLGQLEQLQRTQILDPVVDARPVTTGLHQPLLAQSGQLLGGSARIEIELSLQCAHRLLALTQNLQKPDSHRRSQRAEELRLQRIDR